MSELSMIEQIYNAINEVLGGNSSSQFFSLCMPGTVIDADSYKYDISAGKPIDVMSNESRLVNKMFDPAQIIGSDNGRNIASQFLTALGTLTPIMNGNLASEKQEFRKLLMTDIKYTNENSEEITAPLQRIFFMLYDQYIQEKKKWAQIQEKARKDCKTENEFIQWYANNAEPYIIAVEEKYSKLLSIFSEGDMKIIEGVLDSSAGEELQEARELVRNARRLSPDGGYIYPVTISPADWVEDLDSDFDYVDLLESPDAYFQKKHILINKRNSIQAKLETFAVQDKSGTIHALKDSVDKARGEYNKACSDLLKQYTQNGIDVIIEVLKYANEAGAVSEEVLSGLSEKVNEELAKDAPKDGSKNKPIDLTAGLEKFKGPFNDAIDKQAQVVTAAQSLSDKMNECIAAKSQDLSVEIKNLQSQLNEINEQLEEYVATSQLAISSAQNPTVGKNLFSDKISKRFMQVSINTNASSIEEKSSSSSSSSCSSYGVSFLFGGYQQNSSSASSDFKNFSSSASTSIDIGFLATKVTITRNWLETGVFSLTKDMFRTSHNTISNGYLDLSRPLPEQFNSAATCLFPCIPTAFVIVKDVTIKFSCESNISSTEKSAFESHCSKGGGFFCFSGSSSSSSSGSCSSSVAQTNGKELTIRIPGPQIIGYYQELMPKDESTMLNGTGDTTVSVSDFVESYRKMLNDMYNKDTPKV